jgi:plastocyanin
VFAKQPHAAEPNESHTDTCESDDAFWLPVGVNDVLWLPKTAIGCHPGRVAAPENTAMRRLLLTAGLLVLGACGGESDATPTAGLDVEVAVKDFAFAPKQVRVATGGVVTWTNADEFDHSIVIADLDLDGPKFGPQTAPASYSHRFTASGTFPYICGVHNSMTGTVVATN